MSASGSSSNRRYEQGRGWSTGTGHGIYAAEGDRQYRSEQNRKHDAGQAHNTARCDRCRIPSTGP